MSDWLSVFALAALALGLVALGWWLLIETEGVYLGQRAVTWLYDRYARRYEEIKRYQPHLELQHVAGPLVMEIGADRPVRVLDVATGTGRLPLALLRHARFAGGVVGVDLSAGMLAVAAERLAPQRVKLARAAAERLPFADASFAVVTCLEALEFVAQREVVLREMARVCRPGGVLLATNRLTVRWMPGRGRSPGQCMEDLEAAGFSEVQFERWQIDYDKVWARRAD